MSSDDELERLLREGRTRLPEPDGPATRRAHERALAAARRRRGRRERAAVLVVAAIVVVVGSGIGVGALVATSGTASEGPVAFGFVPAPGWFALQPPTRSPSDRPAVAMAANVPFDSEDVVNGLAEPSSLPYSTLLSLPPRGIVIVATFIAAAGEPWSSARYPTRRLPLRVRDAIHYIEYGTQIRPDQPLGQYQLRATVDGWNVEVNVYFGTPRPSERLENTAQRQLDSFVAHPAPAPVKRHEAAQPLAREETTTLDRTFSCTPSLIGGVRKIYVNGHGGSGRHGSRWDRPAFASIRTTVAGAAAIAIQDELVWITGGRPSTAANVLDTLVGFSFPVRTWGTLAVNRTLCRATSARIPLSPTGLYGGVADALDDRWGCAADRRILVRIRAVLESGSALRTFRGFARTTVPAKAASVAVRTQSGRPLSYAEVDKSGKARLFTARSCVED